MKKRIISIISVVTALILTVFASGCDGCNSTSPLSFTNAFLGGGTNDATSGYYETVTYSVEYDANYNSRLKKSDSVADDVVKFTNGLYKTDLKVVSLQEIPSTGISVENTEIIYQLKTSFSIDATYKITGDYADGYTAENQDGSKTYHDEIDSEVYFLKAGQSFAPLYSKTVQKNSLLYISDKSSSVSYAQITYETVYSSGSYKTTSTTADGSISKTCEYDYKKAIDNVQLLFALRNIEVSSGGTYSLPTIAPAYDSAQTLNVSNNSDETVTIKVNGNENNENIKIKRLSFSIATTHNTGIPQYALIQTAASASLENKALLVEYAAPLVAYGTMATVGALVYKIQNVSVSE